MGRTLIVTCIWIYVPPCSSEFRSLLQTTRSARLIQIPQFILGSGCGCIVSNNSICIGIYLAGQLVVLTISAIGCLCIPISIISETDRISSRRHNMRRKISQLERSVKLQILRIFSLQTISFSTKTGNIDRPLAVNCTGIFTSLVYR